MRRRLQAIVPIVLLAILVQVFAPIAAFRAAAYAASDPLRLAPICSEMASSPDAAGTDPANTQHKCGACCAFCAASHGGASAVEPPQPAFVILQRHYRRVAWMQAVEAMPTARVGSNAQARAPPQAA